MLRRDDLGWMWFVTPLLSVGVFGGIVVSLFRSQQLSKWDLSKTTGDPSVKPVQVGILTAGVIVFVVFMLFLFSIAAMDPRQRVYDALFWLLGTTLGALGGLVAGLQLADNQYKRQGGGR